MTNTSDGHFPSQGVMPNLCIIFIQLIEGANLEEQYDISVLLFDLPVLLLRVCRKTRINVFSASAVLRQMVGLVVNPQT